MPKDWINEALELTRQTEQRERERTRKFTSDDIRSAVITRTRMPVNLPGLAEALEIDRKLRRQGK